MQDWNKVYKDKGEIQFGVIDLVKDSLKLLKERDAKKVFDLCFGTGRHIVFLAENGFEVYGIDNSEKAKEMTKEKAKERNLKNVHLQVADMHELPYEDKFFDAIIAVYALEHNTLDELKKVISELERILKSGGILVATLISRKDPRYGQGTIIEPHTYNEIKDLAEYSVYHRFSDEKEVRELFFNFKLFKIEEKEGFSKRRQMKCVHWEFVGEKK
ncbi:MAG: class I SAM-dependent methyltransferase [archaeon]